MDDYSRIEFKHIASSLVDNLVASWDLSDYSPGKKGNGAFDQTY